MATTRALADVLASEWSRTACPTYRARPTRSALVRIQAPVAYVPIAPGSCLASWQAQVPRSPGPWEPQHLSHLRASAGSGPLVPPWTAGHTAPPCCLGRGPEPGTGAWEGFSKL